jgi:DNA-directed RNA polymerase subunit K/omega
MVKKTIKENQAYESESSESEDLNLSEYDNDEDFDDVVEDDQDDPDDIDDKNMSDSDVSMTNSKDDDYEDDEENCELKNIEDNDEYNVDEFFFNITENIVDKKDRISSNRMTKYEFVRIIGSRIKQLTDNAKPLIKNIDSLTYSEIALEELRHNMVPFKLKRPLPNGKIELWELHELEKDYLFT